MLPLMLTLLATGPEGPIRLHPDNPHYLLFRGKPTVLITSGEHYGAVLNLDFDYVPYLGELASKNLNLTRTFSGVYCEAPGSFNIRNNTLAPKKGRLICPWARSDTEGYANGGNKFDLERWDPEYFQRLRHFVGEAGRQGIVVELVLFCPFYKDEMWALSPMNARNNVNGIGAMPRKEAHTLKHKDLLAVQERFVRKVVSELKDFDNLYYEICNEPYFGGVTLPWQKRIAATIVDAEHHLPRKHLIAQNIANGRKKVSSPDPNVSILNFHYATPPDTVAMNYGLNRPIGDDETGFKGGKDATYRGEGWEFILAGGAIYSNLDYSFTPAKEDGSATPHAPGGGGATLRSQLKILKTFIGGFTFIAMKPDNRVIRGGVPDKARAWALVQPGRQYAIYIRGGDRATLTLELPEGPYKADWVNTKTGAVDKTETFDHSGGPKPLASPRYSSDVALRVLSTRK